MRRAARRDGRFVGALCARGHDLDGAGKSLRARSGHCVECVRLRAVARLLTEAGRKVEAERRADYRRRNIEIERIRMAEYRKKNSNLLRERSRLSYQKNSEKERTRRAEYKVRNAEKERLRQREVKRKFRETGRAAEYARSYYSRNAIRISIRNRVYGAIEAYSRGAGKSKTLEQYGVDLNAIINRLGPCPGVRSEWHIDHVRPLCSFDLEDRIQAMGAFLPSIHQWLPAADNRRKSGKWDTRDAVTETRPPLCKPPASLA